MSLNEDLLFDSEVITYKVLIVCLGNTCRSIIYHSLLSNLNKANYEIFSAGINSKNEEISEFTKKVLNENNIPIVKEKSNNIKEYKDISFDKIIVLDKTIKASDLMKTKIIIYDLYDDPHNKNYNDYQNVFNIIEENINFKYKN